MKHFNNLRNKLREGADMPNEFSWENTSDGIFEKMDEIQSQGENALTFRVRLASVLLIAFTFCGILYCIKMNISNFEKEEISVDFADERNMLNAVSDRNQIADNSSMTETSLKEIEDKTPDINNGFAAAEGNVDQTISPILNSEQESLRKQKKIVAYSQHSKDKPSPEGPELKEKADVNKIRESNSGLLSGASPSGIFDLESTSETLVQEKKDEEKKLDGLDANWRSSESVKSTSDVIFTLSRRNLKIANDNDSRLESFSDYIASKNLYYKDGNSILEQGTIAGKEKKFSLIVGLGSNYWSGFYNNSPFGEERSTYEKEILGFGASIGLGYHINRHFSIRTGIGYDRMESKLQRTFERIYQEQVEDVVVEILINPVTDARTPVMGNAIIDVTETRNVVHYNRYSTLAVPVSFNYHIRRGKFDLFIGLGTSLRISMNSTGRTSIGDEVVDFGTNNIIHKRNLVFGVLSELGVNYDLNERFFLGLRANGVQYFTNWSAEENLSMRPGIVHGQILAGIRF